MKILYIALVVCGTAFFGSNMAQILKKRTECRRELMKFLEFYKASLSSSAPVSSEICRKYIRLFSPSFFIIKENLCEFLSYASSSLTGEEKDIINDFASRAGRSPSAKQEERLCESYIKILEKVFAEKSSKDKTHIDLWRRLSVALGMGIAIILV